MDNILTFIGLMKKAGALAIGAERGGEAVRAGRARLFCLAQDSSDNTRRAARNAMGEGGTRLTELPYTKLELGAALGQEECAAIAILDRGFARALAKRLGLDYGERATRPNDIAKRAERAASRAARPRPAVPAKRAAGKKTGGAARHAAVKPRRAKGLNKGERV